MTAKSAFLRSVLTTVVVCGVCHGAVKISYSGRLKPTVQPGAVRYYFVMWARKSGAAIDQQVGEGKKGVRLMLHPAGRGIVLGFDGKGEFEGEVVTTEIGPGYHQAVVAVLEDFRKHFADVLTVRDTSKYWDLRDRQALERAVLAEVRTLLDEALRKWPAASAARMVTPMGPLDRRSVEGWLEDVRLARNPEVWFPWWSETRDGAYWVNLACTIYFGRFRQGARPRDAERILQTLKTYFSRGKTMGCETWLSQYYQGDIARSRGRLDTAEAWLHAALEQRPQHPDVLLAYGEVLLEMNQPKRAEAAFRMLSLVAPDSAEARLRIGLARSVQGDYAGALVELDAARKLNPKFAAAWAERGLVLREMGRHTEALTSLQKGHKLDPRNEDILYNLGATLVRLKRYEGAEKRLRECLELNPRHYDALVELGNTQLAREDLKAAAATYYRATRLGPKNWQAFFNLGRVYERMGRPSEARQAYKQAQRLGAPKPEEPN